MWLNRESPCLVLAFCGSALAPPAPCSKGGTAWIDSFIFLLHLSVWKTTVCHLSTASLLFWRSQGDKKHALRCFPISRRRSVVFVAKNMLKYHRFFLLLLSFPVPSPAICLQMEADSAWDDLPVLRSPCALPGSQAQCRTWTESPSLETFTNPAAFWDKVEWEGGYRSKIGL